MMPEKPTQIYAPNGLGMACSGGVPILPDREIGALDINLNNWASTVRVRDENGGGPFRV